VQSTVGAALALRAPANPMSASASNTANAACFQVREICITKVWETRVPKYIFDPLPAGIQARRLRNAHNPTRRHAGNAAVCSRNGLRTAARQPARALPSR